MVSKEAVKAFLSKLNSFVEKIPDITEKLSKLEDDKEFQKLIGRLGTVGGFISIGLYLFDKTLDHLEDTEKTYYSLINKTAISVAKQIIEQEHDNESSTANKETSKEILERMMRIYTFKETNKKQYDNWNGNIPYDHPIIQDFKKDVIEIMKENNSKSRYINFVTEFDIKFDSEIRNNSKFLEYQIQKSLDSLSGSRRAYYQWILEDLDKPNPVDKKRASDYYVKSRAIELDVKDELSKKDHWNISDIEAEEICKNKKQWEIKDFLKSSKDTIKLVAAPFGTGKTSFIKYHIKDITTKNLLGQSKEQGTWIPIYVSLNQNINSTYRDGVGIIEDLNEVIKPDKENVLIVCDGIDEYPDYSGIVTLKDRLLKIRKELDSGISISQLKVIFTTRLEAGLPERFGAGKFVRLLPFTSDQVTEFFERYGHQELSFEDIKRYELQEKKNLPYQIDLLKPLFCWMFALSYRNLEITRDIDAGEARLILYSTFIHSILEGRYKDSPMEIVKEKWILRKIAALKMISDEVYEEELSEKLQTVVEQKQKEFINLEEIKLHIVLTSYFKLNKKGNNKHSVEFLHKSFQEYLLAEYYIESILYNEGFRLNIGQPSDVTIEFLVSLLSLIKNHEKKEYEKYLLRIIRSLYPNKADWSDENIMQIVKVIRNHLMDNALKIFEENKIVFSDFENKTLNSEYWKIKDVPSYSEYYKNFLYKAISLFLIKKLDPKCNPKSIIDYIKDSYNFSPFLKYFPFTNLSGSDLSDANLYYSILFDADLSDTNLNRANLSYSNLSYTNLNRANLIGADLSDTNLNRANLSYSNLSYTNLNRANLIGADLSGTKLYRADLSGTILSGTILSGTILSGADLSGAITLKPRYIQKLFIDENTVITGGITDDKDFFNLLKLYIKSGNMPILVKNKEVLIKELQKKLYTEDQINEFVKQSKFA